MNNIKTGFVIVLFSVSGILNGQSDTDNSGEAPGKTIFGFVRGGLYGSIDDFDDKAYIPSAFSDLGLKVESPASLFRTYADLRFRYGTEFSEKVSRFDLREAYISINGKKWDVTAGQKIVKWGRADFTNPTSKLSSQNLVSRSPDREDMDMGNLLVDARWHPLPIISLEAVAMPYYRPSVLMIDPLPLPFYVTINQAGSLMTGKEMFGYGLKADMHARGLDMSVSWFDGYDPMPGTELTSFSMDLSDPIPVPYTSLTMKPYKIRNLGFDFETTIGIVGVRGEAAWTDPYESYRIHEYVACEEIEWAAGFDWMPGNWRITAEYSGKVIPDFEKSLVDPVLGTEPDPAQFAMLLSTPGFDLNEYVRQQVGAFNRLYNYQLEKSYHSAAVRIETDLFYARLTPSLTSLYNFTSGDFLFMPELICKPADGLTINLGGEFYSGRKGSVYDLVNEFMNCIRISLRVDF